MSKLEPIDRLRLMAENASIKPLYRKELLAIIKQMEDEMEADGVDAQATDGSWCARCTGNGAHTLDCPALKHLAFDITGHTAKETL